jgi:hypothetical protein
MPPSHRQPFLSTDLRTPDELHVLKDKIKKAYQHETKEAEDNEPDLRFWVDSLVRALCYETTIQALIVKEILQPGYHWSTERHFDPLWVIGVQLPGAFGGKSVDTWEKIIGVVDSLAKEVLEKTGTKLLKLLDQGIATETDEYGEGHFEGGLAMIPATTPPMCILNLIRTCRQEIEILQGDVALKDSLGRMSLADLPACRALSTSLQQRGSKLSLLDRYTINVTEELISWIEPWMMPEKLPSLTTEDIDTVKKWRSSNYDNIQRDQIREKARNRNRRSMLVAVLGYPRTTQRTTLEM